MRPHLKFLAQAWALWLVTDVKCLEKVQQRAMNIVTGLTGPSYEEKLQEIGLLSQEERHHQADIHIMHKIMHGEGVERASSAAHATRKERVDPFNVTVKSGHLDLRRNFYSMRVITDWYQIRAVITSRTGMAHFKVIQENYI